MEMDWIVEEVLGASPLPRIASEVESLAAQGVRAIITLTERSLTTQRGITPDLLEKLDIRTLHIPIDDFGAPTRAQAEDVVAFIDMMQAENRPALIHCKVGQGRTGTLLHAYFIAKGYSLQDARYEVSLRRPLCDFNSLSDVQREFLEEYATGRMIIV